MIEDNNNNKFTMSVKELIDLIKNENRNTHVGIGMISDEIVVYDADIYGFGNTGMYISYSDEDTNYVLSQLYNLIDKQLLTLRVHPYSPQVKLSHNSEIRFLDLWRHEIDGERDEKNKQFKLA